MSLVETLMQPLRQQYAPKTLDKNELRLSRYGGYDLFKRQAADPSGILTAENKAAIKASFGNSVVIPVLDADDVTIGNVRSCTVADSENTSKLVTLTFVTFAFGFTMTPSQHFNNDVSYQADFNRKLEKYLFKFAATLDSLCINKLNIERNQFWGADILAHYAQVGNALQVPQAEQNDFYNKLSSIFEAADFYGNYDVLGNTLHQPLLRRLSAQGIGNGTNEAFQIPGYDFSFSNRVANGAGVESTVFAVPPGMVAIENRNDPDSIRGTSIQGGSKRWAEVNVPIVDLNMGSFFTEDCADKSGLSSATVDLKATHYQGFQWSTDICLVSAYNSAPTEKYGPILKAELLS